MMLIQCIKCNKVFSSDEFYSHYKGQRHICKSCMRIRSNYVSKCVIPINTRGLCHYYDEIRSLYNEVGESEFLGYTFRKHMTLKYFHRCISWGALKQTNKRRDLAGKKYKFTKSCVHWLRNTGNCK